jgi:hypothetical protein
MEATDERLDWFVRVGGVLTENPASPQLGSLPRFFDVPNGLGRVNVIGLCTEFVTSRTVPLRWEDIMLRLAVREMCRPKAQSSLRLLT